ncbi:MAG: hypothetical protein OXU36_07555 [Candidatus Poribacteria bacterium]|nr:hypothetical protein [Candidatus Poribacteria bacterium]
MPNQRYEARVGFTGHRPGYEVRMDFTEVVHPRTQTVSLRYKMPTHHDRFE